jgi:hypothetical protein
MQIMKSSLWFSDSQTTRFGRNETVGTASRLTKALHAPYREAVMVPFSLTAEIAFPLGVQSPG